MCLYGDANKARCCCCCSQKGFLFSFQVEVYAGAIYDAIYLYAIALNETLAAGGSKKDGRAIVQRMLNKEFDGLFQYNISQSHGFRVEEFP